MPADFQSPNAPPATPFDMAVLNRLDRFHLADDVINRVPMLGSAASYAKQVIRDRLIEHAAFIRVHGEDMPDIKDWRWVGHSIAALNPIG